VALSIPWKTTSSGWISDGGSNGISGTSGFVGPILAAGPWSRIVWGGVVSAVIVHVYVAGVGSTFPSNSGLGPAGFSNTGSAMSRARTSKVCWPGAS
jgi:hypothetical protein